MSLGIVIGLLVIGFLLMLIELLVTPGFGIWGIASLVCIIYAIVKAFFIGSMCGTIVLVSAIVVFAIIFYFVFQPRTWKRVTLSSTIDTKGVVTPQELGIVPGMEGTALGRLTPSGKALINGHEVEVFSPYGIVDAGTSLVVERVEDMKIYVKILS